MESRNINNSTKQATNGDKHGSEACAQDKEIKVMITLNDCCDPCCNFICCNFKICNESICSACDNDDDDDSDAKKYTNRTVEEQDEKLSKEQTLKMKREKLERARRQSKMARIIVYCSYLYAIVFLCLTENVISNDFRAMESSNTILSKVAYVLSVLVRPRSIHTFLFSLLFLSSLVLFWYLTWSDPGTHENNELVLRSKFCRSCQKLVRTFDHHCVWTGNCVGEGNRKTFILYVSILIAFLGDCLYVSAECGWRLFVNEVLQQEQWGHLSIGSYFALFMIGLTVVLLSGFSLFPLFLWFHQLYLISVNLTSYESMSPEKCPYLSYNKQRDMLGNSFHQGILNNWKHFLFNAYQTQGTNRMINWSLYLKASTSQKMNLCEGLDEKLINYCCPCCS